MNIAGRQIQTMNQLPLVLTKRLLIELVGVSKLFRAKPRLK
jgi:hypothetical protein